MLHPWILSTCHVEHSNESASSTKLEREEFDSFNPSHPPPPRAADQNTKYFFSISRNAHKGRRNHPSLFLLPPTNPMFPHSGVPTSVRYDFPQIKLKYSSNFPLLPPPLFKSLLHPETKKGFSDCAAICGRENGVKTFP